jgi:hypothetical protein
MPVPAYTQVRWVLGGKCLRPVTVATLVNPVRVLTRFRKSGKFRPKTSKVQVKHEKSPSN